MPLFTLFKNFRFTRRGFSSPPNPSEKPPSFPDNQKITTGLFRMNPFSVFSFQNRREKSVSHTHIHLNGKIIIRC